MKRIRKEEYKGDGKIINLDIEYIPYEKLLYYPEKYLDRHLKYYFTCSHGIKSREVVTRLSDMGYDVTQII